MLALALIARSDPVDTGDSQAPAPACEPAPQVVDVGDDPTAIHGTTAFDGQRIWVAWARPNDSNTFDVMLAALGCDGALVVPPTPVTASADNELDPSLAVSGERLLVAWTASSDRLSIRTRVFDLDGAALTAPRELAATRQGQPVTGNAMGPRARGTADGFVLAGSWGHDDAPAFQAFHVALDLDGEPLGDAVDAQLDVAFGQTAVDLVADPVVLAWQEDSTTSTAPVAAWSEGLLADPGARPTLGREDGALWAAWDTDDGRVQVRTPAGETLTLPLEGFAHSPRLEGRHLLTMEVDSGVYNALHVHELDDQGLVDSQALPTTSAPSVYGVDLTAVGAEHLAVAWSDGSNPDFQLHVALVER